MRWMNLEPIIQNEAVTETVVAETDKWHLEMQNRVYSAPARAQWSHLQTPPSPALLFPPAPPNPWLRPRQKQWASKITEAEVVSGEQKLFKQDNRQKAESCYSQWGLVFQLRVPTSNQVRKRKASIIY